MSHLTLIDAANRSVRMSDKPKRWTPKKDFHPGGEKGKLHRELGIKPSEKIPAERLESATHSSNPEVRRDAIRAKTMEGWHHGKTKRSKLYDRK